MGLKFPKSSIVREFGGEERDLHTSALFKFFFILEISLASWDICSFSDWPSDLLTLLICAHFALSKVGVGVSHLSYIRERLTVARSYFAANHSTERIYDWYNAYCQGRRKPSRVKKPCRPLGGEAPVVRLKPGPVPALKVPEGEDPWRVENAFRTVTSPWTVEWSEKLQTCDPSSLGDLRAGRTGHPWRKCPKSVSPSWSL